MFVILFAVSPPPTLTSITPAQTVAFNSYMGPAPGQTANGANSKPTNMTMQLPAGGLTAFIPPSTPGKRIKQFIHNTIVYFIGNGLVK